MLWDYGRAQLIENLVNQIQILTTAYLESCQDTPTEPSFTKRRLIDPHQGDVVLQENYNRTTETF